MANNVFAAITLTGGIAGALDYIDGDLLTDKDIAVVGIQGTGVRHYILDATSGAAESSPGIIAPDTNPGTKRWIEARLYYTQTEVDTLFTNYTEVENHFQNGECNIWQRYPGSAVTIGSAAEEFVMDRLGCYRSSGSALVVDQIAFTAGQTTVPGNPEFYHESVFTTDSSASEENYQFIRIKDVEIYSGETVVFSIHGKVDSTKNVALEVTQNFGSGGSTAVQVQVETLNMTTSFVKKLVYITVPTVSTKTIGTLSYTEFKIWNSAGSNFNSNTNSLGNQSGTLHIAEIKIYPSDKERTVRRRSKEEALIACKDYYREYLALIYGKPVYNSTTALYRNVTIEFDDMIQAPAIVAFTNAGWAATPDTATTVNSVSFGKNAAAAGTVSTISGIKLDAEL